MWHDAPCTMKMWAVCEEGKIVEEAVIDVIVPEVEESRKAKAVTSVTPAADKFYVIKEKLSWHAAEAACAAKDAHLAAITSPNETKDVNNALNSAFPNAKQEKFWIGLNENDKEDSW